MANWYVTDSTFEVVGNTAYGGQTVDLTISPVDSNGVHSGAHIAAKDFKIGGATESPTNVWSGGNVTSGVASVTFSNLGTAGDINNTVRARVTFASSGNFPTSVADFVVDIDQKQAIGPPLVSNTPVFLRATYAYYTSTFQSAPVVSDVTDPDITETVETAGSSSADYLIKFTGDVELDTQHTIAEVTFTAASGYYYADDPLVIWVNVDPPYDGMYSSEIIKNYTNGLVSSFVVKLKFHKISPSGINPFLSQNIIDEMNHQAFIKYTPQPIEETVTDTITDVDVPAKVPWYGGIYNITVSGAPSSKYLLELKKKVSLTDADTEVVSQWAVESGDVRDNFGIFEFRNKRFGYIDPAEADATGIVHNIAANAFTMNDNKKKRHQVNFYPQEITRRYDVTVGGIVKDKKSKLKAQVPKLAGEKSIIQYGLNTLSITPLTYDNTSNFGTLPAAITVKRPIRYENDPYGGFKSTTFVLDGNTRGIASTTLTLTKESTRVKTDMVVSGKGVSHGTKITRIRGSKITLNKEATISSGSKVRFDSNDPAIINFSFTIPPAQGKTLSVTDSWLAAVLENLTLPPKKSLLVGGSSNNHVRLMSGSVSASATVNLTVAAAGKSGIDLLTYLSNYPLAHGTRGIVPGMTVHTGDDETQLTAADGTGITVASVTDHNTIVLSAAVTLEAVNLIFKGANNGVDILNVEAEKVGNDVVVRGALRVKDLHLTSRLDIYLDSLITAHN
jgi:hypothetical protein|tara:strand:- start:17223 stop:19415 length:2193 start_codon:yes stop_codon:yes gene_type:complete